MKTAVEILEEQLYEWLDGRIYLPPSFFEQAKEMEKEQIEDFFNAGVRYGSGSVMSTEWGEDTEEYNFEQFKNKIK